MGEFIGTTSLAKASALLSSIPRRTSKGLITTRTKVQILTTEELLQSARLGILRASAPAQSLAPRGVTPLTLPIGSRVILDKDPIAVRVRWESGDYVDIVS